MIMIEIYTQGRRVALAIESLKSRRCEKRDISGIGCFFVCPQTGLKLYTEGGQILISEKVGVPPVARISCGQPFSYEISHPDMAAYIDQIPKPAVLVA